MKPSWAALCGALLLAGASTAPAATVADLHFEDLLWGEAVEIESLRDRVTVVYYWAAD